MASHRYGERIDDGVELDSRRGAVLRARLGSTRMELRGVTAINAPGLQGQRQGAGCSPHPARRTGSAQCTGPALGAAPLPPRVWGPETYRANTRYGAVGSDTVCGTGVDQRSPQR